jgi:hypothetical protein
MFPWKTDFTIFFLFSTAIRGLHKACFNSLDSRAVLMHTKSDITSLPDDISTKALAYG